MKSALTQEIIFNLNRRFDRNPKENLVTLEEWRTVREYIDKLNWIVGDYRLEDDGEEEEDFYDD